MTTNEQLLAELATDISALTQLVDLNDDPATAALAAQSTDLATLAPHVTNLQGSADAGGDIIAAGDDASAAEAARDAAQAAVLVTPDTAIGASTLENAIRARYKVSGRHPSVIVDPVNDVYFSPSGAKSFGDLVNHTRNNPAVFTDHTGVIQVASSDTPRLRHHVLKDGIWQPAGFRFDRQATNFLETSEDFTSSNWGKENVTLLPGATTAPDGTNTATEMQFDHDDRVRLWNVRNAGDMTAPGILTFSIYAKRKTADWVRLVFNNIGGKSSWLWFNLATGVTGATRFESARSEMIPMGDGWYRISASMLADGALSGGQLEIAGADADDSTTANTGEAIYVWGAQAEVSPVPTSYIRTEGTQVTREADVLTIPNANLPSTASAFTFIMEGEIDRIQSSVGLETSLFFWGTGSSSRLWLYLVSNGGSKDGEPGLKLENASGSVTATGPNLAENGTGIPFKIAASTTGTATQLALNGAANAAVQHDNYLPDLTTPNMTDFLKDFSGTLTRFRIFDTQLPENVLIAETAT